MKLSSKKSAPKKSPFVTINKQELKEVKGGKLNWGLALTIG